MTRPHPTLFLLVGLLAARLATGAELNGVLDWSQRTPLSLPVSGVIDSVNAQPGQWVKKGELLLALNPTVFKAQVAEARAELDRLTEDEADARRDLERVKELYARTVSSTTELDAAQLRHARARAGLAAAQARVERARRLLAESELRAPFDALVLERHAEQGMAVAAQCQPAVLFTVARGDELVVLASLPAAQALGPRPGDAARISLRGREHTGVIRAVRFPPGREAQLEVVLPRGVGMAPGQPASVSLRAQP